MNTHRETPDQRRAKFAWDRVHDQSKGPDFEKYANLAKGAPALILSNGLMQALAYMETRKEEQKKALSKDVCCWLTKTQGFKSDKFSDVMASLQTVSAGDYMRATDEVMQLLRWIRQFVSVAKEGAAGSHQERQGGR